MNSTKEITLQIEKDELTERFKALAEEHEELVEKYDSCQKRLKEMEQMYQKLNAKHYELEVSFNQLADSHGNRLMNKYYNLRDVLFPRGGIVRRILKKIAGLLFGQKPQNGTEQIVWMQSGKDPFEVIQKSKAIDILTPLHTMYLAKTLQNILKELDIECNIFTSVPKKYKDIPYIIICPQIFKKFPEVYIAMQMEQTINSRWLTEDYMNMLYNACAVFDYSLENIAFLRKDPRLAPKLYYMPVDVCVSMMEKVSHTSKNKYDVLFYGDAKNKRRQKYLKAIAGKSNLHVASEVFGEDLYAEMNKAKIVINVHYYENALLETARLYETLSVSNCLIISEHSGDPREEAALEGIVDFVDVGDVQAMVDRIRYWLDHEEERAARVAKNHEVLKNRISATKFYLCRFLLAHDNITFDKFYESAGGYIHFNSDRVCLSLPESIERRAAFDADNAYGFEVFPGLKHRLGWIGCGMSYKFMLRKAMEQQMENILICEDDVYFPPDFDERFSKVLKFVGEHDDWTVFSGIMADLGRVSPLQYVKENEEEYIYLDKMISMVFNLYDKSIFEAISDWDYMDRDVQTNTIDRYLEKRKMRILTTCPFLVGHKEDLHSTIWGAQNTIYTALIANSSVKLQELVEDFKQTQV